MAAHTRSSIAAALVLTALASGLAAGCGGEAQAEPLEVTYYYLPG